MVKLKLNREELQVITLCTNPRLLEQRILGSIKNQHLTDLEYLFILMDIGEKLTKKFYFSCKPKNNISLKPAEVAAYLTYMDELQAGRWDPYTGNVIEQVKNQLHQSLTNYKQRIL